MSNADRRRHVRVETENLVSYVMADIEDNLISQGMGNAVNVSGSGILLESARPINCEQILLTTVDPDNRLIELKGKIVRSRKTNDGKWHAGIGFLCTDTEISQFSTKLIETHQRQICDDPATLNHNSDSASPGRHQPAPF
jgi:hypothetical protein